MNVLTQMPDNLVPESRSPLGPDISEEVRSYNLTVPFDWRSILNKKTCEN